MKTSTGILESNERYRQRQLAKNPRFDADRKAKWRAQNPAKASLQQFKDSIRAKLRKLP